MRGMAYDVVIVGAGGAGLTAAYRLGRAGRSVLILERQRRIGGRTKSIQGNDRHPCNLGTQFMVGTRGSLANLRGELEIPVRSMPMFPIALHLNGKYVEARSNLEMLLRLPLSFPAKVSLARHMLSFQRQARRFHKPGWMAGHADQVAALDNQTYDKLLRRLHPEARPFFALLAGDLCGNRPDRISAVGGIISTVAFELGDGLVAEEGNDTLQRRLLEGSGANLVDGATVTSMQSQSDRVTIAYERDGREEKVEAAYAVSALPADVALDVIEDLADDKRRALEKVVYGPFVTGIFRTAEEAHARWRNFAMMVAFDQSFSFAINQSRPFRQPDDRQSGSAIFVMAVTDRAERLLAREPDEIKEIFRRDMLAIFPEMATVLEDIVVEKWHRGLPGFKPGAHRETRLRRAPSGRIHFAGDYLGDTTASLSSAVSSGEKCADAIAKRFAESRDGTEGFSERAKEAFMGGRA